MLTPANLTGDVTVTMVFPADLAGVVTVGVASSADPASVVTASVAFREECGDNFVIPTDYICDYDEIAEVASSSDFAGNVTVSVTSSVDPASIVTAGEAFREKCMDSVVIPSDYVCVYDYIAEVASSAELAGNVTVGVAP